MNELNGKLSDDELVAHLTSLCLQTSRLKAEIVVYLIEVEERRLHLRMACKSMSDFCINRLNMSTNVAFHRIAAARLVRKHPCLLPMIARGELHLSTLVLLKNHLTAANAEELIAEIHGKSFRDVELLLAARAPRPDIPTTISLVTEQALLSASSASSASSSSVSPTPVKTTARVTPLSPARFAVQLTVSQELRDKLERATEMLRHRNPNGDLEVVLDRALDALLAILDKELRGKTERPRRSSGTRRGNVSREARRAVFARDGERCSYQNANGNRCPARGFLEVDHVASRALGGDGDVSNLRVLCKPHNRLHAEEVFGREHVDRAIDLRRSKPPALPVPVPRAGVQEGTEFPVGVPFVNVALAPVALDEAPSLEARAHFQRPECDDEARVHLQRAQCAGGAEGAGGAGGAEETRASVCARALRGLTHLGFRPGEASRALDAILERHGRILTNHDLPGVLRETIRLLT